MCVTQNQVAATLSCSQLHKRAERIGCMLMEKGKLNSGDHVALVFHPGVDLIAAFYGCLYVGQCLSLHVDIGSQLAM
jgi:acyl-CoA synthetase (AMP-forming)/AMP-acid ligase II